MHAVWHGTFTRAAWHAMCHAVWHGCAGAVALALPSRCTGRLWVAFPEIGALRVDPNGVPVVVLFVGRSVGGVPWLTCLYTLGCVTRRNLHTPGSAEEHKRQETPTTNPNDRQPAHLADQEAGTIEGAAQESRRITPASKAAGPSSSTTSTRHHYPHPTGSPGPLSLRSPRRRTGGLSSTTTHTLRAAAGTRGAPRLGGPVSGGASGQPRAHGEPLGRGRVGRGGWGGGYCDGLHMYTQVCKCKHGSEQSDDQ